MAEHDVSAAIGDDFGFGRKDGPSLRRRLSLVLAAGLLAGVGALVVGARLRPPEPQKPQIVPLVQWLPAPTQEPPIRISGSLPEPLRDSARVLSSDNRREDTLLAGDWNGDGPFTALTIQRPAPPDEAQSFIVDLIRRAGDTGLAMIRSAQPLPLGTRFGTAEVAEMTLAGAEARACLAFRLQDGDMVGFVGWHCPSPGVAADRIALLRTVACLFDRMAPGPGADDALAARLATATPLDPHCLHDPDTTAAVPAAKGPRPRPPKR